MKLWETKSSGKLHPFIERFTIGQDLILDAYLLPFDCLASAVHAFMLQKKGYLKVGEFKKVKKLLREIYSKASARKFELKNVEDSHSAIEGLLTKKLGELGGKIHLGRSRNDQSATTIHLFAKDELLKIRSELLETIDILQKLAEKYADTPMPGYTHTRPAMVSTLGHYFAAFAETLSVDYISVEAAFKTVDRCPLGSAAGYGTSVAIDRKLTAKLLGFGQLQVNTLSAQLGRGQVETTTLAALVNVALTLSRIANDLIYFSTPEFDFFELSDAIATGSSIMPQKKNPDPLEIIRAAAGMLIGGHTQSAAILEGLSAGYQRDLQLLKQPFVQGVKLTKHCLQAFQVVLKNIKVNDEKLERAASDTHLFAADIANELVLKKGLSFREAYRKVKEGYTRAGWRGVIEFDDVPHFDPAKQIKSKRSDGMPGNLRLDLTAKWTISESKKTASEQKKFAETLRQIWSL
ncbi:MAG: argininosuccinate lyase [Candidatus Peribacteraceae bacterium]|nr:argininosuccinate lyase [Candidatus Peribacteraceae bacterium]